MTFTAADFMSHAPKPTNGSSAWAQRYAATIRGIVTEHANNSDRNLQRHLGPSEIGVECDRQVVSKLAGLPPTNHITDPWPSIVGTAVHAWLAECFTAFNTKHGQLRFIAEQRVYPTDTEPGTADLYDAAEQVLGDHKCLGETSMAKVRSAAGPPRHYVVQMLLYALGYRRLGLPVKRVALIAYPRTSSSLAGLYVWDRPASDADAILVEGVLADLDRRKQLAHEIMTGRMTVDDLDRKPDDYLCYFCPFYRSESAKDGGPGCPGTVERV